MDWFWMNDRFLGIEWHWWKAIGWAGNLAFFLRFMVQWYASERQKRVVVPISFWWLSLVGSFLLLAYAIFYRRDSVFIFAYAFTWVPYIRNLILGYRDANKLSCPACHRACHWSVKYCPECGTAVPRPVAQNAPAEHK